jgi:hypothetical protein
VTLSARWVTLSSLGGVYSLGPDPRPQVVLGMPAVMPSLPRALAGSLSLSQRCWASAGGSFAVGRLPSSPLSLLLWDRTAADGVVVSVCV